jgi:hypothetical protein
MSIDRLIDMHMVYDILIDCSDMILYSILRFLNIAATWTSQSTTS